MPTAIPFSPAESFEEALRQASELWGIQDQYWDIFGNHHITPPSVQKHILTSMGVDAGDLRSLNQAIEDRFRGKWCCLAEPTLVVSAKEIPVQVPAEFDGILHATFLWEDGSEQVLESSVWALPGEREAVFGFVRKLLPLPAGTPLGYHTVRLRAGTMSCESRLIVCPERAYEPDFLLTGSKAAGVAVSLYGLRSNRNWGCGDLTDLLGFTDWIADEVQASFVALNPLHSIPNRQPYNTSPYLPNSSYYRNPIYLDVERADGFGESRWAQRLLPGIQQQLADLRGATYVEYERVWALKLSFLKLAYRQFMRSKEGTARLAEFVRAEGELLDRYAVYCALDEVLHKRDRNVWIWPDWPDEYQDPDSSAVRQFAEKHQRLILFYKYMQWQLDIQLEAAQNHALQRGLKIGLYHDLALATDRCGSDLWAYRPLYVSGCRVGSPPDAFSPSGQDWAFPPPNSVHHEDDGYRQFAESIRKNAKHGGALRIDHVMRFFRLFWIPDGTEAKSGVYVRDHSENLLRILALESVRNQVTVIGEDLGTVESYIRETLHRFGILSYRLLYFEKREDGTFKRPDEYPRESLVSVSTHDLPTLAGFWTNRDIRARRDAGVLPDEASFQSQLRQRSEEKQNLVDLFGSLGLLPEWHPRRAADIPEFTGELHNAAVGFLASAPSELMVLNQEDLFKDPDQQNLPGTTAEYPNWRHKLRYSLEELRTNEEARACTRMFRDWLEKTGRLN